MISHLKKLVLVLFLFHNQISFASGGYDNGTPAGKGNLDIDITINPLKHFGYGQSYVVWGYGLSKRIDFHGYASHSATGVNQLYSGFMYNFMSNKYVDLSTAIGLRFRQKTIHSFVPQLLYTIKLPKGFDVIGSVVLVCYTTDKFNTITSYDVAQNKYTSGVTYDIAVRAPLPFKNMPSFIKQIKFAVGAFRGVAHNWYPTYSIDFRFNLWNRS
jgi:hypothetical protein